jgi:hypothetical protein
MRIPPYGLRLQVSKPICTLAAGLVEARTSTTAAGADGLYSSSLFSAEVRPMRTPAAQSSGQRLSTMSSVYPAGPAFEYCVESQIPSRRKWDSPKVPSFVVTSVTQRRP